MRGWPVSDDDLVRDIVHYAIEIFRESWDQLYETPDGIRVYDFYGDDFPRILFYAAVESTVVYDFAIVEQVVNIFDVEVVSYQQSLEEPD
jgi:hypothetical protein